MPDSALPLHLRGTTHADFPWGLRWIPRAWTSYAWGSPTILWGNVPRDEYVLSPDGYWSPKPITSPGTWQISLFPAAPAPLRWLPLYLAFTTAGGRHFRIGARWDDVDNYVTFPTIATKR